MFLTYLGRELRRRRRAALVVASGLALGIALVIVVSSVSTGMKKAQDDVLHSLYGLGTDMTVTKARPSAEDGEQPARPHFDFDARGDGEKQAGDRLVVQGLQTLDASTVRTVARQDGVAEAVGALSLTGMEISGTFDRGDIVQPPAGQGGRSGQGGPGGGRIQGGGAQFDVDSYRVYGVDVTHPDLGPLASSKLTKGRGFRRSETDAAVAVVDADHAKTEKLGVGDKLTVKGKKFTVIGLVAADSARSAADVYLPLKTAQTLSGADDAVTTVFVRATDSQRIDAVKSAIQQHVDGSTVTTASDLADTVSGSLTTASGLAATVGKWLSIVVLVVAFLVAGLLTSSAVSRRVREFGTLKALGWRSGRVIRQVAGEALVSGLAGGVLGIALGLAGAWAVTAVSPTLTAELGGGGGAQPGRGPGGPGSGPAGHAAATSVDIALSAPVSLSVLALAVGLAVAGGLVAGGFGGWRASRLRPADALRRVE